MGHGVNAATEFPTGGSRVAPKLEAAVAAGMRHVGRE